MERICDEDLGIYFQWALQETEQHQHRLLRLIFLSAESASAVLEASVASGWVGVWCRRCVSGAGNPFSRTQGGDVFHVKRAEAPKVSAAAPRPPGGSLQGLGTRRKHSTAREAAFSGEALMRVERQQLACRPPQQQQCFKPFSVCAAGLCDGVGSGLHDGGRVASPVASLLFGGRDLKGLAFRCTRGGGDSRRVACIRKVRVGLGDRRPNAKTFHPGALSSSAT